MRLSPFAVLAMLSACSFANPPDQSPVDGSPGGSGNPPPDACQDDDHDGVCNDVDKCPGADDNKDSDGDGIPDCMDDWPCGAKPTAPDRNVSQDVWSSKNLTLQSGQVTLATVAQGATLHIETDWGMFVACGFQQQCDQELKFGADDTVLGCIAAGTYNNLSGPNGHWQKDLTFTLTDGAPKVFSIKLDADGSNNCDLRWSGNTPGSKSNIAEVCVTP